MQPTCVSMFTGSQLTFHLVKEYLCDKYIFFLNCYLWFYLNSPIHVCVLRMFEILNNC